MALPPPRSGLLGPGSSTTAASPATATATAYSPFAPPRRKNSFLTSTASSNVIKPTIHNALYKRSLSASGGGRGGVGVGVGGPFPTSSSSSSSSLIKKSSAAATTTALAVGFLLVVLRFWKTANDSDSDGESGTPRPTAFLVALQQRLQELPETTTTTMTKRLKPLLQSLLAWIQTRMVGPLLEKVLLVQQKNPVSSSSDRILLLNESTSSRSDLNESSRNLHIQSSVSSQDASVQTASSSPSSLHGSTASHNSNHRFAENQRLIRSVLKFWFGQYGGRLEELQKKVWMIPAESPLRPQVDAEIAHQFAPLLLDLTSSACTRWSEWCGHCCCSNKNNNNTSNNNNNNKNQKNKSNYNNEGDHDLYGYQGKLAAILVLDQFSRHMRRHLEASASSESTALDIHLPEQSALDDLAHMTAQLFMEQVGGHDSDELQSILPVPMQIFALMPFRHVQTTASLQYVQDQIQSMDRLMQESDRMVRRFRKATNSRLAVLLDESRRMTGPTGDDKNTTNYSDESILESFPVHQVDMSDSRMHPVHQTVCSFLEERDIHPTSKAHAESSVVPILISLSGGVDSMVLARVLAYMKQSCRYHLHITALHIDYANRPESAAEADFCRRYCKTIGIHNFECKRIDEVSRGVTDRDEYERVSRQLRYDFYRQAVQQAKTQCKSCSTESIGVVLGHHRGDLRENVLSNAHKGCGPLDLSGMTAVSQNDGVTLFRPLLALEKKDIFEYAHKYGVPYFKDTTPHWSTRGKLRNKLLPLLEEIYGEGSLEHLSDLAVESDECRSLLHKLALAPFLDQVRHKRMGITFATAPWKHQGTFFWKYVLREALHSAGLGMFTDKSALAFLERIQAKEIREGWLQCRKDYGVYLQYDGQVFVFFPSSFPWSSSDELKCKGRVLYGPENAVRAGPWRVTARRQLHQVFDSNEARKRLGHKAVPSMEAFMDGSLEYYVPARTCQDKDGLFDPRPLVFTSFTKATRPRAWKGVDLKLQEKLPLLGNDDIAIAALKDPFGCGAVHTNEEGKVVENPVLLVKVTLHLAEAFPMSP